MIVEIDVHDSAGYEEYKKLTPATLVPFGGKFVVRGGNPELIEGLPAPKRIVVLQFENKEKAKAWYNSAEYQKAVRIRQATSVTRMILADGV
jgi:uncharacterized protein (DUF1330 family)